jgi:hypothetical protein
MMVLIDEAATLCSRKSEQLWVAKEEGEVL